MSYLEYIDWDKNLNLLESLIKGNPLGDIPLANKHLARLIYWLPIHLKHEKDYLLKSLEAIRKTIDKDRPTDSIADWGQEIIATNEKDLQNVLAAEKRLNKLLANRKPETHPTPLYYDAYLVELEGILIGCCLLLETDQIQKAKEFLKKFVPVYKEVKEELKAALNYLILANNLNIATGHNKTNGSMVSSGETALLTEATRGVNMRLETMKDEYRALLGKITQEKAKDAEQAKVSEKSESAIKKITLEPTVGENEIFKLSMFKFSPLQFINWSQNMQTLDKLINLKNEDPKIRKHLQVVYQSLQHHISRERIQIRQIHLFVEKSKEGSYTRLEDLEVSKTHIRSGTTKLFSELSEHQIAEYKKLITWTKQKLEQIKTAESILADFAKMHLIAAIPSTITTTTIQDPQVSEGYQPKLSNLETRIMLGRYYLSQRKLNPFKELLGEFPKLLKESETAYQSLLESTRNIIEKLQQLKLKKDKLDLPYDISEPYQLEYRNTELTSCENILKRISELKAEYIALQAEHKAYIQALKAEKAVAAKEAGAAEGVEKADTAKIVATDTTTTETAAIEVTADSEPEDRKPKQKKVFG